MVANSKKLNGVAFELIDEKSIKGQINYWQDKADNLKAAFANADPSAPIFEQLKRDMENACTKVLQLKDRKKRKPVNVGETYKAQMFNK